MFLPLTPILRILPTLISSQGSGNLQNIGLGTEVGHDMEQGRGLLVSLQTAFTLASIV